MSPPDTLQTIDREHYDLIVSNSRDLKYLCREVQGLREDVSELRARECPCDAVRKLQDDSTNLRVRVAGLAAGVTLVGNWVFQAFQGVR
jgi:hypothetical protein